MEKPKAATKKRRRILKWIAGLLVLAVGAVLALPWILSSAPGRTWLLRRANAVLAPGKLEVGEFSFSWFRPTRMTDFVVLDPAGDRVVNAPLATLDRSLQQIFLDRHDLGTLRLERAFLDIERAGDGTIDLIEAIRPLIGRDPKTRIKIEIVDDSHLRLRAPELAEPIEVEHIGLSLGIQPSPLPLEWSLRLFNGLPAALKNSLQIEGQYDGWAPREGRIAALDLKVLAKDWPFSLSANNVQTSGHVDANFIVNRPNDRWRLAGGASFSEVEIAGPTLKGDRLVLNKVLGTWDVSEVENAWAIKTLEVTSPVAKLKAEGTLDRLDILASAAKFTGQVDLAAIAVQLPHLMRLREGLVVEEAKADLTAVTLANATTPGLDIDARLSDFRLRQGDKSFVLRDPAALSAHIIRPSGLVRIERLSAATPYLKAEATGDLSQGVKVSAKLDLSGLQRQLRDLVEMGAVEFAGVGEFNGTYKVEKSTYQSVSKCNIKGLNISGVGPTNLAQEAIDVGLDVNGPAHDNGFPRSWNTLNLQLTAGELSANVTAGITSPKLVATLASPVSLPNRKATATGRLEAAWDEKGILFDPIGLTVSFLDQKDKEPLPPARLEARGRYSRAEGELSIIPVKDESKPRVIAIADEGLHVTGIGRAGGLKFEGGFFGEIAALKPWVSSLPDGLQGEWSIRGSARNDGDGLQLGGSIDLRNLKRGENPEKPGENISLSTRAVVPPGSSRVDISELALRTRYATLESSGRLNELFGQRTLDLRGTFAPNWDNLTEWLSANVEPRAAVAGQARPLRLQVSLGKDWRSTLEGEFGIGLDLADIYGMKLGPTAFVARAQKGKITFDPIDTHVNSGQLHLEPEIRLGDEKEGASIQLGRGSTLEGAEVNDEVSRRVLSFVAPVLDNATRVHGRVSATIEEAVFPVGEDRKRGPTVKGAVQFQDLTFVPGPLFEQLLAMTRLQELPTLRLNEPVSLTIADRRVYQRGMAIPIGKLSKIELDGWVDFDRNLNLTAGIPILPTVLADRPLIGDIARDAKIRVPIRGTFQKPEIDKEAFNLGMKEMGRDLLGGGMIRGAAGLFQRMFEGRPLTEPVVPPPPGPRALTPEERRARNAERKAQQKEKRDERRMRRGFDP